MTHPEGESSQELDERALVDLPVFPLPGVVLFPRALLPLHIFEPRYRELLAHCLATHKTMAIANVPDPSDRLPNGEPRFARVAGVGMILEHQTLPDGRSNILLHGRARVELDERPSDTAWRRARATIRTDLPTVVAPPDRAALLAAASQLTADLQKKNQLSFALPTSAPTIVIADLCAHHLVTDAGARQAILEQRDPVERVHMVLSELLLQRRSLAPPSGGGALN